MKKINVRKADTVDATAWWIIIDNQITVRRDRNISSFFNKEKK